MTTADTLLGTLAWHVQVTGRIELRGELFELNCSAYEPDSHTEVLLNPMYPLWERQNAIQHWLLDLGMEFTNGYALGDRADGLEPNVVVQAFRDPALQPQPPVTHFVTRAVLHWEYGAPGVLPRVLEDFLLAFPVPAFGSPPSTFVRIADFGARGGAVLTNVALAATDHPVLVVVSAVGTFVYWFAKPSAYVLRRSAAERLARAVGTSLEDGDES